jgi:hypothetical protein
VPSSTSRAAHSHGAADAHARLPQKQLRVSGCRKQPRRSQLVRAVSPVSTTRIGCGGQARAAAGGPAPCSVGAHVRQPLQQAAPAATHVSSRTHDLWMRERLIERCAMAAAPTRGLRRGRAFLSVTDGAERSLSVDSGGGVARICTPVSGRSSRAGRGVRASSGVEPRRPHDLFMLIFNGFICFIHPETDSQGWLHPITFPHFSVQHTTSSRAQRVTAAPTRRAVRMRAVMACRAVLPPINGAMASAVAVARHPTMIEQRRK